MSAEGAAAKQPPRHACGVSAPLTQQAHPLDQRHDTLLPFFGGPHREYSVDHARPAPAFDESAGAAGGADVPAAAMPQACPFGSALASPAPRPRSLAARGPGSPSLIAVAHGRASAVHVLLALSEPKTGRPRAETGNCRSGLRAWLRCPRAPLSLVMAIPAESEAMLWFGPRHHS